MIATYLKYWFSIQGISQIIKVFEKEKHDIRFVGGCVRDALLGNKSSDIDFAINCEPDITAKLLIHNNIEILEYGKKYGTITAIIEKKNIEITSLREDINQSGRYTEVQFTDDWKKDAMRRDFTFNAINISPIGKIEDYFNGQNDIKLQRVKFIGSIEERIKEDYLRILRYFRFQGLFKSPNLIEGYEKILYRNLPQLRQHISNDRIRNELLKTLKNIYRINSIVNPKDPNQLNTLIKTINNWWTEDKYDLGLHRCMNKINELIINK